MSKIWSLVDDFKVKRAPAWDFPPINHALDITNEETFVITPGVSLTGVKDLLSRGDFE
jgi:hypothetical protein